MDQWAKIQKIFDEALQLSPELRQDFVERVCLDNQDLLREVKSLLAAHEEFPSFLQQPAVGKMPEPVQQEAGAFRLGQSLGPYRITSWIGRGGMGEVYCARDVRLKRNVALKTISKGFAGDPERLQRFEHEARAAAALNHPNIISVYDIGLVDGCPYIVSELLVGQTLREMLNDGPVPSAKALHLAIQLARGLAEAHDNGIVHRDLKPENLFVIKDNQLKILDFGLAKLTRPADLDRSTDEGSTVEGGFKTEIGRIFGTVGYMSPEQVRGQSIDHRSDLFSAGAILYELFSGKRAFLGESTADVVSAILHKELEAPIVGVLPVVNRTIQHALEKDPQKRFQSAHDLAFQLQEASTGRQSSDLAYNFTRHVNSITLPRKALMISVPIAVLLAAILGTTLYTHRKQAKRLNALNESNTVVLADLVNTTGEEVFNAPLKMALSNDLEQSPFWMLLSDAKINQQMRFMGRTPGEHLTVDLAKEICQRQGAKLVLAGSISRHSGHYPITLQGLNCRTGGVLDSEQLEADSREEVLDTLGETAKRLRIKLGESLQSVAKYDVPLTNATTSSFQALQAYTTAMKTAHSLGEEAALGLFKRAIELDPNFTLAYSQLALSYYDLSQFAVSAEYAKKAYEMRARVTERERLAIESFYEQFNRGDFEKTAELYKETQKTYPQDVSAVANLATIQSFLGQYDEAAGNGEEAVRRDPENANNYSNLAGYYLNANRIDKAAAILEDAKKHQFETGLLLDQQYLIAFLKEDGGKISEIVSGVAGNESTESDILALHAATHAYYGRLKKARDLSDQVIASAQRQNAKELEAILSATAALYEAEYGNLVRARHRATSALQLSVGRIDKPAVAFALARTGYTRQATMVAQDLHRQFPQDTFLNFFWLPVINAANALSQSNPAKALDFLEGARFETGNPPPSFGLLYPPYLRGEAYLNLRNGPAAALQFQKIVNHPGLIVNSPLAALVNLQIGRANVLSGDLKNAKVYYDRFFALWREADVDIPILKEASAEYLRLRTQESSREGRNQFQFVSLKSVN